MDANGRNSFFFRNRSPKKYFVFGLEWGEILTDFFLLGNVLVASCEHFVVLYRNLCNALIVVITIVIIIILIVSIQSFTGVVQACQRG